MLNRFRRDPLDVQGQVKPPKPEEAPSNPFERKMADAERISEGSKLVKQELLEAKVRLHRKLIDDLNLPNLERLPKDELRRQIGEIVADYVRAERILLNSRELEAFATEVFDELTGLGPLEPLLKDSDDHRHPDQHA